MTPGRELDALIEKKVMGPKPQGCLCGTGEWCRACLPSGHFPPYSTDIAAAWAMVEHFNRTLPETWAFSLFGSGNDWHVEIDSNDGRFLLNGPAVHVYATGDTAPHAICLAALKAVGAL